MGADLVDEGISPSYEAIGETVTLELDTAGSVTRVRGPPVDWLPKR